MLYLQKVFDDLSAGEFAQLDFGSGAGVIDDSNLDKIVSHINLGLTDLYSRFELRFKTLQLALQSDQTEYYLTSKSAVNGKKAVAPFFIIDTVDNKFSDDIIQMMAITLDSGAELALNSFQHKLVCRTPSVNRLQVPIQIVNKMEFLPQNLKTDNLFIKYKSAHAILDINASGFDPEKLVIDLPVTHYNALLYFCASRATRPMGLNQQFTSGAMYNSLYERECARIKNDGQEVQESGQESKFRARGFV